MKKKWNKHKFTKTAIITGLISFGVSVLISFMASSIFSATKSFGIINDKNWLILWLLEYISIHIIFGSIITFVLIHIPLKRMLRLLQAMEKISQGDFTVRLKKKKTVSKIVSRTVDMFNKMAKQLESTEMLSHDFINNFSHEFKTPIASINGFAKLLKDNELSSQERDEYLDIIIQESERLSNLSINILSLSRLEQQSILTNRSEYNLSEQIRIVIGSLYQKWSDKNLEISFEGEDVIINANKEMLGQVWINLLDNAIKFSPEDKEIKLNISEDNDNIYIYIENYSTACSEEQISRIFDKFYQGDKSHYTNGNGLGLPMVKRIVELHNGTVDAKKTKQDSVIFTIVLPAE